VMTAGTSVIMWLGELITDRGVGNGMSILIFTSIAASFPAQLWSIKLARGWATFLFIIAIGFAIIAAVVFVEQSQRRIPVQYAKRQIGRRQYGAPRPTFQSRSTNLVLSLSFSHLPCSISLP